jgi:Flp pilus assembly protein TadD
MKYTYSTITLSLILGLVLSFGNVMAAGSSSTSSRRPSVSPEFKAGKKAVKKGDFQSALGHLNKANEKNPRNADIHNLLGYSYRKLGDTGKAFEHYRIALKIDPKHRGANEYLGELYLETDQLVKAEERLKVLDKACRWGCEEYDDLKEAIEKYKEKKNR